MDNIIKKPWAWIIVLGAAVAGVILYSSGVDLKGEFALKVNDTTFTHQQIEQFISLVRDKSEDYGVSTEEEIKEEAINIAIQQALLFQHAEDLGLGITKEEVEQKITETMSGYGMTEEDFFAQFGGTREELEKYFEMETKVNNLFAYYAKESDLTEEEIYQAYNIFLLQVGDEMPPFEEAKEDIRGMILEDRVTTILLSKVEEMKEDAKIKILF